MTDNKHTNELEVQNNNGDKTLPPKTHNELSEIPDLSVGDTVRVSTRPNYDTDRKLTVKETDVDAEQTDNVDKTVDENQICLTGYGTEYRLLIDRSLTGTWQRVMLQWPSRPSGVSVSSIEVIDSE